MRSRSLDSVVKAALSGERQALLVECPQAEDLWAWNRPDAADSPVLRLTVRLGRTQPWPYAPYLPALIQYYQQWASGAPRRERVAADLEACEVYFRHRSFWGRLLTQDDDWPETEDLIAQEIPFERNRLERTLVALVKRMTGSRLLCLVVLDATTIGVESERLLEHDDLWLGMKCLILLQVPAVVRGIERTDSLLHAWRAQGRLVVVTDLIGPAGARPPLPELAAPLGGWLKVHVELLAFDSALRMVDHGTSTAEAELDAVDCLVNLQQFEQALYRLLPLLVRGNRGGTSASRADRLAVTIHLGLNDHRLALAAALQAWRHCPRVVGDLETLRVDILLRHLSSLTTKFPEIAEEVATRLPLELQSRGWTNHALYFSTQNQAVMELLQEAGPAAALERCAQGRKEAQRLGNARRAGVASHSQAHVLQALGRIDEAAKVYRRAVAQIRRNSRPHEVARVENGQGYYYMSVGKYREAWQCHARAFRILQRTRYYEETLNTLINLARVQLLAGWPERARKGFETVVVAMEKLQLQDLPYQKAMTIQALLGLAAFRSGEFLRAQQIVRVIDGLESGGPSAHGEVYVWWLKALVARHSGDVRVESAAWKECQIRVERARPEFRYLELQVCLDQGAWSRAQDLCLTQGAHPRERALIESRSLGLPDPPAWRLPNAVGDAAHLLETASRNADWRELQKSLRASHFLQAWQSHLSTEHQVERLLPGCRDLILSYFLVDNVQLATTDTERSFEDFTHRYGSESRWLTGSELEGTGWSAATWLCLRTSDGVLHRAWVASSAGEPYFTKEDHQVLVMAHQQLSTTLVALRQAALLTQTEKMSALGSLVAGIAHEINTPVGIAVTGSSYLAQKFTDVGQALQEGHLSRNDLQEFLSSGQETGDLILRNLLRAGHLIDSFKRVASDQSSEERRQFSLREYLEEVLLSLSPKWKKSNVEVRVEGPAGQVLDSYPGAVAQVLSNLVINALTHAFSPGQAGLVAVVVFDRPGTDREFIVQDNGGGVASRDLSHLFEPFFTTRRNQGGTGLGLHVSYNLVHNVLGGTIHVESTPGEGTLFRVRIPAVAPRLAVELQ